MASLCGGLGSLFLKYLNIVRFKLSFELPALVQPAQTISHGNVCSFDIIVVFLDGDNFCKSFAKIVPIQKYYIPDQKRFGNHLMSITVG